MTMYAGDEYEAPATSLYTVSGLLMTVDYTGQAEYSDYAGQFVAESADEAIHLAYRATRYFDPDEPLSVRLVDASAAHPQGGPQ